MNRRLHVVTYNIHKGLSLFNRRLVIHELRDRLRMLGADIVFLQEVQGNYDRNAVRHGETGRSSRSTSSSPTRCGAISHTAATPCTTTATTATPSSRAFRYSAGTTRTSRRTASRSAGCCIARSAFPGWDVPLHCVCVHLALTARGRSRQIERLRQRIERLVPADAPLIIAGDFNDWHWRHKATHELAHPLNMQEVFELIRGLPARSFPAMLPVFQARPHLRARLSRKPRARAPRPGLGPHLGSRRAHDHARDGYDRASSDGNRLTLLESGREYFPALEAACDAARHEIHVETYIFEDDAAGQRIAAALKRAAQPRRGDAPAGRRLRLEAARAQRFIEDSEGRRREVPRLPARYRAVALAAAAPAAAAPQARGDRRAHRVRRRHQHHRRHAHARAHAAALRLRGARRRAAARAASTPAAKRLWTIVLLTQFGGGLARRRTVLRPRRAARGTSRAAFLVRDNLWHRNDIEEAYLDAIGQARPKF